MEIASVNVFSDQRVQQLAEELFRQKRERRREMALLPAETKFEILLKLQQIAYEAAISNGRTPREPWKIAAS